MCPYLFEVHSIFFLGGGGEGVALSERSTEYSNKGTIQAAPNMYGIKQ